MMDNIENLILEHLRIIRADLSTVKDDVREIKTRVTSLEAAVGGLKRDSGDLYTEVAAQHVRYDRLNDRIEKIERRLDLVS